MSALRPRRLPLASVLGMVAAVACSSTDLAPQSKVDSLRVLAVRADLPFAAPGEKVHLEALVADPHGAGRAVKIAWASCVNPGSAEVPACADAAGPFDVGGPTLDYTVPPGALAGLPSNVPAGEIGLLFAACAGNVVLEKTATSPVRCVGSNGGDVARDGFMWGEKRIVVVPGVRNANPKIADVRIDGASWAAATPPGLASCGAAHVEDCAASQQHKIEILATPDSAETTGGVTEDLVGFFFVSDGRVVDDFARQDGGSFSTTLAPTQVASGTSVTVWLVLRDDRGGVDWQLRSYAVP